MRTLIACIAFAFTIPASAQDSLYTRQVIKFLCSKECFGRGYVKNGLENAEKFLINELMGNGARPLIGDTFTVPFTHPVNTFPRRCKVKLNGKRLRPGEDFIVDPASKGLKGRFTLEKKDSVTYSSAKGKASLVVSLKNKLTFSVAQQQKEACLIELDKSRLREDPARIKVKIDAVQERAFTSRNIVAAVNGTTSDSMIVFTAHYDHLGGMGRKTFFPGANDNASGVSMVLNLVRHYAVQPGRYKCVFIFFAGEEAGLLGSAHLVRSGLLDLKKIKFLVNLDLLGTGDDGIMVVNGSVFEDQFQKLVNINDAESLVKEVRKRGKAANSDHYHFSEKGVPSFFIYTLGGTTAYHDVRDVEKDLPLTDYKDVFQLIIRFSDSL